MAFFVSPSVSPRSPSNYLHISLLPTTLKRRTLPTYITSTMPEILDKIQGAVGNKLNQKSQPGNNVERTADTDVNSSTVSDSHPRSIAPS